VFFMGRSRSDVEWDIYRRGYTNACIYVLVCHRARDETRRPAKCVTGKRSEGCFWVALGVMIIFIYDLN
jgi:hypothetical protein